MNTPTSLKRRFDTEQENESKKLSLSAKSSDRQIRNIFFLEHDFGVN